MPAVSIGLATMVTLNQHRALEGEKVKLQLAQTAVQEAAAARDQIEKAGDETRYAATAMGPFEESAFLTDIRSRAQNCGVQIRRWDSHSKAFGSTPKEEESKDPEEQKREEKLKGIVRISSDLTIAGPYSGVRKFLGGMIASPRLFTLGNVKWTRSESGGTELVVSVSRYVQPAEASETVASLDPASTGTGVN
jgi:hypothetical protein